MKLATNNYSQSDIETKLDTGYEMVSVEAKYLSEVIRENHELKRMVGGITSAAATPGSRISALLASCLPGAIKPAARYHYSKPVHYLLRFGMWSASGGVSSSEATARP